MRRFFSLAFFSLLLIVVHTTFVSAITISTAVPDILLVWIVYLAITQGQVAGTVFGFGIGLMVDIISGHDSMLGLSALTKSFAGFVAGYFYNENKTEQTLTSSSFLIAAGICSLLHNGIYFLIFLRGSDVGWWQSIALHGIPSTLYTTVLAVVPMSVFRRKYL
jgi:rod shape-determining protein MreD